MNTQTFWMLTTVAISLADIYICFSFYNGFFEKRIVKNPQRIIIVSLLWIFISFMSIYIRQSLFLILSTICMYLLIALFFYEAKVSMKIFSAFLLLCIGIVSESIVFFALLGLSNNSTKIFSESLLMQIQGGVISKIIFLIIVKIICSFRKSKLGEVSIKFQLLLFLMPIMSIVIVYQIISSAVINLNLDLTLTMGSIISVLYINIVTFILFEGFMTQSEDRLRYELANQQLDIQIMHYKELHKSRNKTKAIWHDMKNHLFCIEALASQENQSKTLDYVRKLNNTTLGLERVVDTGNPVIDSIIEDKIRVAKENGIKMVSEIMLPEQISIEPIDICIILGNALDNAIEANNRLRDNDIEKKIELKISSLRNYVTININNTCPQCQPSKTGLYLSSKRRKETHGFGLLNIRSAVNKYNGNMTVHCEHNKFTLHIIIVA